MSSRLYTQILLGAEALALGALLLGIWIGGPVTALFQWKTCAALLVTAVVAGVVGHWLGSRLTRGIEELRRAAKALSTDDYQQRVWLDVSDEFTAASTALHEVAVNVHQERRRAEEEIERLSTILESMADGVIVVSDRYDVLLANSSCRDMLRLSTANVVGRPLLEVTRSRTLYDAVGQALSRPGSLTTDLTLGDQRRQDLLLRASQLPGIPCPGIVVVLHDVTEVRRLENIRKEFVANVSHELKTPLASIKAYAETLRLGAVNDPEHNVDFVTRIEEDANRLNGLIADMLQIARIESQHQAFKLRPIEIGKQVHKCISNMAARAEASGIELQVVEPPEPILVQADEEGVQTILANLVDNAIKYTPRGGCVTVRWGEEADSMLLSVEDTGMGIEPELQDRIFERFFRVDRARTRDAGGTGLGLSIVKHLLQAFDGSVTVHSALGEGSRFQVRIPLSKLEKVGA